MLHPYRLLLPRPVLMPLTIWLTRLVRYCLPRVVRWKMWKYLLFLAVPFLFLCLSTVYIQAHYVIDAIAGLLFGTVLFFVLGGMKLRKS